jgi:hypothetical protein
VVVLEIILETFSPGTDLIFFLALLFLIVSSAGYYCSSGSQTPFQNPCTVGHFCPIGSSLPTLCEAGTYSAAPNASFCPPTPAGFYTASQGAVFYTPCPLGFYCDTGSFSPIACPIGTFGASLSLTNISQCSACVAGSYCGVNGKSAPTGPCAAGYYCLPGASVATPTTQGFGAVCPAGTYCPLGSAAPTPCAPGSFRAATLGSSQESCTPCPPGQFCSTSGLTAPSGSCLAGFYCGNASTSATATVCPPGAACPGSSASPASCTAGTFANASGLSSCLACPPGYQCAFGASQPVACQPGSFCIAGTGAVGQPCPAGRFSASAYLTQATDCALCTPGSFCSGSPASTLVVTGPCDAGYYCMAGSVNAQGGLGNGTSATLCPRGAYCVAASATFAQCPPGKFSPSLGNSNASACMPCTPGMYCNAAGLSAPTGVCGGGYYCIAGASAAAPDGLDASVGGQCGIGSFCTAGSSAPALCEAGSFQSQAGASACVVAPLGFFVDAPNASAPTVCGLGFFCPNASSSGTANACPAGWYGSRTQLGSAADCTPAPPGSYVATAGLSAVSGSCAPGFACFGRSVEAAPLDSVTGAPCEIGTFCPAGSGAFQNCTPGMYCDAAQLAAPTGLWCVSALIDFVWVFVGESTRLHDGGHPS